MKKLVLMVLLSWSCFAYEGVYYFDNEIRDSLYSGRPQVEFLEDGVVWFKVSLVSHDDEKDIREIEYLGEVQGDIITFDKWIKNGKELEYERKAKIIEFEEDVLVYVDLEDYQSATIRKETLEN